MKSSTTTKVRTYTVTDVENVFRRLSADFYMVADSSGALTRREATDYVHDIYLFAINDVLDFVDVTLLCGKKEIRAIRYQVNADGKYSANKRPGGVLWPSYENAKVRILIRFKKGVANAKIKNIKDKCKLSWVSTKVNVNHKNLDTISDREYSSNSYGVKRTDWSL